jgi:hypothetical protein
MQNAQTLSYRHFPHSPRLILRYSTEDTPSLLHINSIASPSFRWSIYGDMMEKRCRCYGPVMEQLRSNTQVAINNLNESSTKINAALGYMN